MADSSLQARKVYQVKPTPGTVQWIAPHLSEGEVKAIYEAVVRDVIGRDLNWTDVMTKEMHESYGEYRNALLQGVQITNDHKIEQRKAAAKLFNMGGR